jgi:predicted HTH domain antitoxin
MTLTISTPDELGETLRQRVGGDLSAYAREVFAVSLYRSGMLSHKELTEILGVDRWQAEEVLRRHGVVDITPQDLERDDRVIRQHLGL